MFLGTEFEKTRIKDSRISGLEPKKEVKQAKEEENFLDEDLLSNPYTENSMVAESYKIKFMQGLYDLFRSEDRDNFGHISYEAMVEVTPSFQSLTLLDHPLPRTQTNRRRNPPTP